ncbi:hypothetical protein DFH27DRAFT_166732 [Peziza echinospora]|nr:hypothetical protein DFH27DRAFT_166732 [Peziza echinospora]
MKEKILERALKWSALPEHKDPAYHRKTDWCDWKVFEDEIQKEYARTGASLEPRKATGAEIALLRKWFRRGFQSTSWNKKGITYLYQKEGLDQTFWDMNRIKTWISMEKRAIGIHGRTEFQVLKSLENWCMTRRRLDFENPSAWFPWEAEYKRLKADNSSDSEVEDYIKKWKNQTPFVEQKPAAAPQQPRPRGRPPAQRTGQAAEPSEVVLKRETIADQQLREATEKRESKQATQREKPRLVLKLQVPPVATAVSSTQANTITNQARRPGPAPKGRRELRQNPIELPVTPTKRGSSPSAPRLLRSPVPRKQEHVQPGHIQKPPQPEFVPRQAPPTKRNVPAPEIEIISAVASSSIVQQMPGPTPVIGVDHNNSAAVPQQPVQPQANLNQIKEKRTKKKKKQKSLERKLKKALKMLNYQRGITFNINITPGLQGSTGAAAPSTADNLKLLGKLGKLLENKAERAERKRLRRERKGKRITGTSADPVLLV